MFSQILPLARLTMTNPQEGAGAVLSLGLDRSVLWPALGAIVALSVILSSLAVGIAPSDTPSGFGLPQSPIVLAVVMTGGLVLTVFCLHYIGRSFGGRGGFTESLTIVIWLQLILLMAQVVQLALLVVSFGFANMFGIAIAIYGMWLFVNFVAVVHGFKSLLNVFAGILVATFGVIFGLSIFATIVALVLGLDVSNV